MGSDRARVTYDPKQQYRSVVMQQGRVTLEADWNEAGQITNEEIRREALDIVGPCGTPDGGYQVTPGSTYDLSVGNGTMYVGGMRTHLPHAIYYSSQPDWLNYDSSPDPQDLSDDAQYWVQLGAPAPIQLGGGQGKSTPGTAGSTVINEFIYLYLREQEIGAVEDPNLLEVALGGPDTAARTRLLQHIVRVGSAGPDCASGMSAAQTQWASQGISFHPASMRLQSEDTLLVSFSDLGQSTPCLPQAQGGYLDPDNQLIRVQISGVDPLTGKPSFVWGFDNASFLYRISLTDSTTMKLQSAPVDTNHQPVSGQAVEILRSAAELDDPGAYVAALSGFVVTLDQNYDPGSQSIQLPSGTSFPHEFLTTHQSPPPQLFLRVWQQEVVFTPGQPIALGDTGLRVTLQTGLSFHTGDYWQFAVRPSTPQSIYPARYQNAPQLPEGPRMWACPLAVVSWNGLFGNVTSDCRPTFGPLASRALHVTGVNWPSDDLVSLPAFRNNALQVNFDYSPTAQSVSDSTMIVTVEIPYLQAENSRNYAFEEVSQAKKAVASAPSVVSPKKVAALSSRALIENRRTSTAFAPTGAIPIARIPVRFPFPFNIPNLPNNLLSGYQPLLTAAASASASSGQAAILGCMGLIQPGNPSVALGTVSWNLQKPASEFVSYLSDLSLAGFGPQARVRVTLKGRDIWNGSSNPLVYLDGQVFGQSGLRADGTTPCTAPILPSGSDARASDFENWFWLSLFVWGQTDFSIGDLPLCLTTADFNNDGAPDIAVATLSGGVYVLMNNGHGGFTVGTRIQVGDWPLSIVAADFNGDGFMDLAVTSYTDGTVTILLGSTSGAFTVAPSSPMAVGKGPWALVAAQFVSGQIGLAVSLAIDNTVVVLSNQGGGTFTSTSTITGLNIPIGLVAVDLDGNKSVDLAVLNAGVSAGGNSPGNNVFLFANNGQGAFPTPSFLTLSLPGETVAAGAPPDALPLSIITADFNNDGFADLAVGGIYLQGTAANNAQSYVVIFLNDPTGTGKFGSYLYPPNSVSGVPASLVAANLDPTSADGSFDLVATGASFLGGTSTFSVLVGNGDGTFEPQVLYPINANPIAVAAADFNGDGIVDLAMTTEAANVSVLLNEQSQITAAGAIVITGLSPSGPVKVGQQLIVTGQNFGFSLGAAQAFIDAVQVTAFLEGSSDKQLIFAIPTTIVDVPAAGRSAVLTVANAISSASRTIFLIPAFTLGGDVDVNYVGAITGNITANQAATFEYTILSRANLDATYTIQPLITGPANAQIWNNNLQVLDSSQTVIPTKTIPLFAGQQSTFYVSINPVPNGATGSFELAVTANSGTTVSGGSPAIPFTVGQAAPQPDTTITMNLELQNVALQPATGGSVTSTLITLSNGAEAMLPFQVTFTVVGSYSVTAVSSDPSWSATIFAPGTPSLPIVIQESDLNNSAKTATRNIGFVVAPSANAISSASVQFQIQNAGVTKLCSYPMNLQL